ncbi:hypothetical protein C8Q69DRAFT_124765 [Paecilomyces variotii]|uniref:Uncharacterized protein n=1 Tax=Byssochlamys spectabilis TaxID=264951 RepID=A0A443HIR9_BYSSP|nr:hypothetical protein C8Q69DRAFT_124765 [Paecilomyces variotii]RWQ91669.1 hypothetical protein C8Q69DRAFT_124765 [Paecilomyces variotii]
MNPTTTAAAPAADLTIAPTTPAPNRFLVPFEYLLEDSSLKEHAPCASHLTRGQRRNVQLMPRPGYTYKQISRELGITIPTLSSFTCQLEPSTPQKPPGCPSILSSSSIISYGLIKRG